MRYGSLFSGYGGLDLAVAAVFDARCAWHCELDGDASTVLAHHWPDVPNLRDITAVDWSTVEPVDILCGGFPCQDISSAGRQAGIMEGTRSGLWYRYADAIRHLRPRVVVVENVGALVVRGLDIVLGSLAEIGFDAEWCSVRASDVGAPHRRERVFIVAADSSGARLWQHAGGPPTEEARSDGRDLAGDHGGERFDRFGWPATTDTDAASSSRRQSRSSRTDRRTTPDGALRRGAWGPYAAAIERWERATRTAPPPTDAEGRLNPQLPEWMMGLPAGWVTDLGLSRTAQLRLIGNGVCPQQAEHAIRLLLDRAPTLEAVS